VLPCIRLDSDVRRLHKKSMFSINTRILENDIVEKLEKRAAAKNISVADHVLQILPDETARLDKAKILFA
jgi:hypothetical protein